MIGRAEECSDRGLIRRLCGGQLASELGSANNFAKPWLHVDLACGEMQEEKLQYFVWRRSDVDDDGASCQSTRTVHVESSSGSRI